MLHALSLCLIVAKELLPFLNSTHLDSSVSQLPLRKNTRTNLQIPQRIQHGNSRTQKSTSQLLPLLTAHKIPRLIRLLQRSLHKRHSAGAGAWAGLEASANFSSSLSQGAYHSSRRNKQHHLLCPSFGQLEHKLVSRAKQSLPSFVWNGLQQ